MKLLALLLTLAGSGVLGYQTFLFATARRGEFTASSMNAQDPARSVSATATGLNETIEAASKESGSALRERLAANFKLLGIDESWADALAADSAKDFPALAEKLPLLNSYRPTFLELMFLDRWAQLDPEGAAAYFKGKVDEGGRAVAGLEDALANFIRQWGFVDFEKAAAKALEFGETTTRRTLREKAMTDPAGFLAWAKDHPETNPISIFISINRDNAQAVSKLAELDLDRVLAWAKEVPLAKWRSSLGPVLAEKLAQRDADGAIKWAKELGDPTATSAALAGVAKSLIETEPARALGLLKEMSGQTTYDLRPTYREIIEKLGLSDPDRAISFVEELPKGSLRDEVFSQAVNTLMASDPRKALALAEKMDPRGDEMRLSATASTAPKTASEARRFLEAASNAGPSNLRTHMVSQSLGTWARDDPGSLADYINSKAGDPEFKALTEAILPQFAMNFGRSQQAVDPRLAEALGLKPESVLQMMAGRYPEGAALQLGKVTDQSARLSLVGQIAQGWANRDRSDALDWAGTLGSTEEQASAFRSISAAWMTEDSHRASAWISTLPPGKPRDAAVVAMAQQVAPTDPDLSWQWAMTMKDPALRSEALGTTARHWNRMDAAGLETALANSELTPGERADITSAMAQPVEVQPMPSNMRVPLSIRVR